jgi:thiol-disulfide isomerase/thioredoxin
MPAAHLYRFDKFPENVTSASILGEDSVVANGKNNSCDIIQIHWRAEQGKPEICEGNLETLWVDKASYVVLRTGFSKFNDADRADPQVTEHWVVTFNSYELNGPMPEWLQHMKQHVEEEDHALSARMTGKVAPGFSLKDLEGNSVSLDSLRGKIVLLDFWATWCGPCRQEEAVLEKLEKEQGRSSLAVVRITNEATELVKAFLRRTGENFPSLVDGGSATRNYEVRGAPTLVFVDNTGRIAGYYVGFLDENQLRAELEKAGM